jgi:hypothetical protein
MFFSDPAMRDAQNFIKDMLNDPSRLSGNARCEVQLGVAKCVNAQKKIAIALTLCNRLGV